MAFQRNVPFTIIGGQRYVSLIICLECGNTIWYELARIYSLVDRCYDISLRIDPNLALALLDPATGLQNSTGLE